MCLTSFMYVCIYKVKHWYVGQFGQPSVAMTFCVKLFVLAAALAIAYGNEYYNCFMTLYYTLFKFA